MKKQFILLLIATFVLVPLASFGKIDDTHVRSVVQVLIYDNAREEYISSGSGVSIGGAAILTNYHVAEDIIKNPDSYSAIICYTKNSQSLPECNYMASAYYRFGMWKVAATYQEDLDLAIIYVNFKKNEKGEWQSVANLPITEYCFDSINPAVYGYEMTGMQLGDEVQTLGFPDYGNNTITYSNGVISNFWMDDGTFFANHTGVLAVGTNARISHGSSGGAAFDKEGKFLGITSAGIEDDNGNFITGVIIPVTTFNWWWKNVLGGEVSDWFGYTGNQIPDDVKKNILCTGYDNKVYDKLLDKCVCKSGYTENDNGNCIINIVFPGALCKRDYGQHSYWTLSKDENGNYICDCESGYEWNPERTQCVANSQEQIISGTQIDMTLSKRLAGKLLLQVEQRGAIWYVDTVEFKRYSVTWANALPLFRKLSLGITDADLAKIPIAGSGQIGDWSTRSRLKGKLLLQVEQRGAIWYIDHDGYRHSVTWDNLLPLFQSLALGITNNDLSKISVGSLEGF